MTTNTDNVKVKAAMTVMLAAIAGVIARKPEEASNVVDYWLQTNKNASSDIWQGVMALTLEITGRRGLTHKDLLAVAQTLLAADAEPTRTMGACLKSAVLARLPS